MQAKKQSRLRPPTPAAPQPGNPTYEEMKQRLAELERRASTQQKITFKVSEKGGCSLYGLGRFPVTLYFEQWMRLLDEADNLRKFLMSNKDKFKMKDGGAR